jgi:lysophospholipase L1-like esterase
MSKQNQMKKFIFATIMALTFTNQVFSKINPNAKISGGEPIFTSTGNASYLVDNKFNAESWRVSNNSWIAIRLKSGPSKIFFNWNNPAYPWSNELSPARCPNNIEFPVDYDLLVSSNSTNGEDGNWKIAESIRGSIVSARGHAIDLEGASWVKMHILNGGGSIDEVQVFDISKSADDVWFFVGTSISANTFKGTPPEMNYADLITEKHPEYNPAMIRGGIGCISSTDLVNNLPKYLKMAGNTNFWAIEMGTNDAWGGTNEGVATFKSNLQQVIDSCKSRGITPVVARVLATNDSLAKWQVHPDYLIAVEELTKENSLMTGPDLYSWFINHPEDLNDDGVHPNASGAANIQRLWAEALAPLYAGLSGSK